MARQFGMTLVLMLAVMSNRLPAADTGVQTPEPNYYPVKIGSAWTYRVGEKKVVTKITKHEKQGDHVCAVVESFIDGNSVASEHIAVTKEALLRVSYDKQKVDTPIPFLKLAAKKGDSWNVDTKIGQETVKGKFTRGEEEIEVPGYKGKTITSTGDFEINGQVATFVYWFAETKGVVKLKMSIAGQDIVFELEKFEEGK